MKLYKTRQFFVIKELHINIHREKEKPTDSVQIENLQIHELYSMETLLKLK